MSGHLPLQFCQILLISPPCLGPRRAQILFLNITSPLKPGQYALSSYVAQSVRWTNLTCCDMASPLIKLCPNRLSSAQWVNIRVPLGEWVRTAATILLNSLGPPPFTLPRSTLRRPNWALRHEFSSLLRCLPRPLACILPLQLAVSSLKGEPHCLLTRKFAHFIPWVLPDMDCVDFHSV
jgi:hypothetical protein